MVDIERMINEFNKLIKFDSLSFKELEISIYLANKLKELGLEVKMDDAGHILNDNPLATGNIYGYLKGNIDGEGIILSSHMDTVSPGINKKAIIENGIVKSKGDSVLGSDDITGIVAIIEVLEVIKEYNLQHPDIEVVFFVAEEAFCKGSSVFDYSLLKSKYVYVLDLAGEVKTIALSAPSILSLKISIHGVSSHAGFEPEKGISAIAIFSSFITKLKLGRIDYETTFNIGTINGGVGKNIIPDLVVAEGEVRGMNDSKIESLLNDIENTLKEEVSKYNASYEFTYEKDIQAYKIKEDSYLVNKYKNALKSLNLGEPIIVNTFGGSDNNNFNLHGIEGIVISNAMNQIHTKNEYFSIDEFKRSANILLKLVTN